MANPKIIEKIVQKSNIRKGDTILEIGPGTGNLTVQLLKTGNKVIAMELDPRMLSATEKRMNDLGLGDRLQLIEGDAIKRDLPQFDVCSANIPYQISSPLVFKLLQHRPVFRTAVIMFQQEFAETLLAKPGESGYSRLSANA